MPPNLKDKIVGILVSTEKAQDGVHLDYNLTIHQTRIKIKEYKVSGFHFLKNGKLAGIITAENIVSSFGYHIQKNDVFD